MKIVFNTDQIYRHGGIEKVMATKANYFVTLPEVVVIILTTEQENQPACYKLDDRIKLIDLEVNYNRSKSYFSWENAKKVFKHFFKQRMLLKKIKPTFIISANYNFDHYWLPIVKPNKTKVIKEIHASGYARPLKGKNEGILSKLKVKFNDATLAKYDKVVVLNRDEVRYQTTNNIVVIPNPIEIPQGCADLVNKKVIAAGRMAPVKGFDQLITAWKIVHAEEPEWELHIFGEAYAQTATELSSQIKNLKLENVVFLKDSIDNIPETMKDYSVYAMSSVTECFPMVLLEALSVGLPIVSYDCPNGPRNIITQAKDGLLMENQNPKALAKGLLVYIQSERARKEAGKVAKINSSNFETKTVMPQWLTLFQNLNKN